MYTSTDRPLVCLSVCLPVCLYRSTAEHKAETPNLTKIEWGESELTVVLAARETREIDRLKEGSV